MKGLLIIVQGQIGGHGLPYIFGHGIRKPGTRFCQGGLSQFGLPPLFRVHVGPA